MKTLSFLAASFLLASCTTLQDSNNSAVASLLATTDGEVHRSVTCNRCTDFRKLVIVNGSGGQCKIYYAKNGTVEQVADGVIDTGSCDDLFDRMSMDLQTAGFSCL